jgi:hypothetical protein
MMMPFLALHNPIPTLHLLSHGHPIFPFALALYIPLMHPSVAFSQCSPLTLTMPFLLQHTHGQCWKPFLPSTLRNYRYFPNHTTLKVEASNIPIDILPNSLPLSPNTPHNSRNSRPSHPLQSIKKQYYIISNQTIFLHASTQHIFEVICTASQQFLQERQQPLYYFGFQYTVILLLPTTIVRMVLNFVLCLTIFKSLPHTHAAPTPPSTLKAPLVTKQEYIQILSLPKIHDILPNFNPHCCLPTSYTYFLHTWPTTASSEHHQC